MDGRQQDHEDEGDDRRETICDHDHDHRNMCFNKSHVAVSHFGRVASTLAAWKVHAIGGARSVGFRCREARVEDRTEFAMEGSSTSGFPGGSDRRTAWIDVSTVSCARDD